MDTQFAKFQTFVDALTNGVEPEPLALDSFTGEALALGQSLNALARNLYAARAYASALAQGDLSNIAEMDNPYCRPLKAVHDSLNQLSWQAKHVTDGYLHQRTFFLDEGMPVFSKEPAAFVRGMPGILPDAGVDAQGVELLVQLANTLNLGVVLVDDEQHTLLFCNTKAGEILCKRYESCETCSDQGQLAKAIIEYSGMPENPHRWELSCNRNGLYYHIESRLFVLNGKRVFAHIIEDITQRTVQASALIQRLYRDDMTGLYNRRYCMEQIIELLSKNTMFTICYFDIDNLKYVNDVFMHVEGDSYIQLVVDAVKHSIRAMDTFGRLGGDEFCVIFRNTPSAVVDAKFAGIAAAIRAKSHTEKPYDTTISYGVMEIASESDIDVDTLMRLVDERMYQYKRANKPVPVYRD